MVRRRVFPFLSVILLLLVPQIGLSNPSTITFESFSDGDVLNTQIAGLTFSNAMVLTAGIGLNEFEFPPFSGTNVVFDNGGPLTISFVAAITDFNGRFTYGLTLTLEAFDASNNLVASTSSLFFSNLALSGDIGSSPNELLSLTHLGGIRSIRITGDPSGGSFVMDDMTTDARSTVPEPSSLLLLATGLVMLRRFRRS